jgi:hypothetical protein
MCPRQESNLRFLLRREMSYPLYDEDFSFRKKAGLSAPILIRE